MPHRKTYTIRVPSPSRRRRISITIIKPRYCRQRSTRRSRRTYCGKSRTLPRGYGRHGTNWECLRKGYGAGMCSVHRN